MMKTVLFLSSVLALGLADVFELDNGQIVEVDFENTRPAQPRPPMPYPYQGVPSHQPAPVVVQPVVVKPLLAPVTQETVVVPSTVTEVTEVAPGGYISGAVYTVLCAAKSGLSLILSKAPALIAGTAVALAICKFTCLCDSQTSIYDAQTQIVAIATPERIARAAEFVTEAVKKYNKIQEK